MNNFLSKTVKKSLLFSIIAGVLLIASIVVSLVFHVNYNIKTSNETTLTVQVNSFFYNNELESLEKACKDEFAKQGLKIEYTYYDARTTGGDTSEIVYVFASGVNTVTKVQNAKAGLKATIATNTQEGGVWHGATGMYVTTGSEIVQAKIPASQTIKATVVAIVLCVIVGAYVAIRYGLQKGIVAFLAPFVGMVLSASVILLTRIPVTSAMFYAVAVGGLLSEVFTMLTLFKMRGNKQDKGEALIVNSVAIREILVMAIALGVALILVGAIATWIVRWFALSAFIALAMALYVGVLFVPSVLASMQVSAEKKALGKTASGYVGAKKQDKSEKAKKVEKADTAEDAQPQENAEQE